MTAVLVEKSNKLTSLTANSVTNSSSWGEGRFNILKNVKHRVITYAQRNGLHVDTEGLGIMTGSATKKRLAAGMIGGLVTSFARELLVYPVIFYFYKRREVRKLLQGD